MYCDDVDGCFRIRQHTSVFQKSSKMFGDMFGFVRTYDDIPSNDLLKLTGHPRCQTRDDDHTIGLLQDSGFLERISDTFRIELTRGICCKDGHAFGIHYL